MSDYIKREDAIKAVNRAKAEGLTECPTYYLGIVPSADVVPKDFHDKTCEAMAKRHTEEIQRLMPKRGEWVDCKGGWKCTACDKWASFTSDFCPNCGADMREREGE